MAKKMSLKAHRRTLSDFACMVSGSKPVAWHHCCGGSISELGIHRGRGRKVSDWLIIPLHPDYHTGEYGIHRIGVAIWEQIFDPQAYYLNVLSEELGYDLIALAKAESSKMKRRRVE